MILNEEEREYFREAARPLIKFLNDNCHPHVSVIVDCRSAELFEGICHIVVEDYLHD